MSKKKTKALAKTQNKAVTNVLSGMGFQFQVKRFGNVDYINASEIAKYRAEGAATVVDYPAKIVIRNFLSNPKIWDYVIEWETHHNEKFKGITGDTFKALRYHDANKIVVTPTTLANLDSKLVKVERGRYGAVWFRHNLALKFVSYINPRLDVYFTDDYINLKLKSMNNTVLSEESREKLRKEAKSAHQVLIDALDEWIKAEHASYTEKELRIAFANETDMINLIVFGMTAAMWRECKAKNPHTEGNMRDSATKEQLYLVARLEEIDAIYIQSGYSAEEREAKLYKIADGFSGGAVGKSKIPVSNTTKSSGTSFAEMRERCARGLYNDIVRGEVQRDNDGQFRDRNGFIRLAWKM